MRGGATWGHWPFRRWRGAEEQRREVNEAAGSAGSWGSEQRWEHTTGRRRKTSGGPRDTDGGNYERRGEQTTGQWQGPSGRWGTAERPKDLRAGWTLVEPWVVTGVRGSQRTEADEPAQEAEDDPEWQGVSAN